jgi:ribosomal protein S18 acetylase RimI-like enzyme
MITVRLASVHDLPALVPLFDAYRQFYGQPSEPDAAHAFLAERFAHHESVIFIALSEARTAVGFTQLYPMFSSVSAARIYVLNDLFVAPEARRQGVARLLLREAETYARAVGAIRLTLSTAHTNEAAQRLYESLGWIPDEKFQHYALQVSTQQGDPADVRANRR